MGMRCDLLGDKEDLGPATVRCASHPAESSACSIRVTTEMGPRLILEQARRCASMSVSAGRYVTANKVRGMSVKGARPHLLARLRTVCALSKVGPLHLAVLRPDRSCDFGHMHVCAISPIGCLTRSQLCSPCAMSPRLRAEAQITGQAGMRAISMYRCFGKVDRPAARDTH